MIVISSKNIFENDFSIKSCSLGFFYQSFTKGFSSVFANQAKMSARFINVTEVLYFSYLDVYVHESQSTVNY